MTLPLRHASFGALALLMLGAACSQVLDIQDARIDATLAGGTNGSNGGVASTSAGGDSSAGDVNVVAGGQSGGAGQQVGGGSHGGAGAALGQAGSAGAEAGASGAGAGASGAGAPPSPEQPNTCESYCDAVLSNCKGKYEQYRTFDQCIEVCKRLPVGVTGDENVNTVECRVRQARFAESEPFVYCKSAGPLGGGKCGSNCVSYCSLMDATCTASSTAGNVERSYFKDTQECLAECGGLPADPTGPTQYSSSMTASPSSFVGNNVFCRTYHVAAALEQDAPTEHCPHAIGGDPCIAQ